MVANIVNSTAEYWRPTIIINTPAFWFPLGKYKRGGFAEEETCEDLILFMKMLSHLTTKDFLDFGGVSSQEVGVSPADVVITGIQIIIPLMTEEILKVRNRFDVDIQSFAYMYSAHHPFLCHLSGRSK